MMHSNIAFDLDGVIANFSSPFCYWVTQMYGVKMIPTHNFHWECHPEITDKMFERIIAEFIEFESDMIPVLPEGAELVEYVWRNTLKPITFITARHPRTSGATHTWINQMFPHIDFFLAVVPSGSAKYRYLDRFDCFIDDRRKTCIDLASRGKVVFMPQRHYNPLQITYGSGPYGDYNATPPSIWRLPGWPEKGQSQTHQIILLDSTDQVASGRFDKFIFKP
jgi:hypothetical protein